MSILKSNPINPIPVPFQAVHTIATVSDDVGELDGLPEGELVWQEDGNAVTLPPDGWLVLVSNRAVTFGRQVRATPALLAELHGTPK